MTTFSPSRVILLLIILSFCACDPEVVEPQEPEEQALELLPCEEFSDNWELSLELDLPSYFPADILYLDENIVLSVLGTEIRRSTDGGYNWSFISQYNIPGGGTDPSALTEADLKSISVDDQGTIYISGNLQNRGARVIDPEDAEAIILRSEDAGLTWTKTYLRDFILGLKSTYFFGNGRGFMATKPDIVGEQDFFFETFDGGETWSQILPGFTTHRFENRFNCSPGGLIYTIGESEQGDILLSFSPERLEWTSANIPGSQVSYATVDVLYCKDRFNQIHKSTDGGATWLEDDSFDLDDYDRFHFYAANENNWLVLVPRLEFVSQANDISGTITVTPTQLDVYETTNGGESWETRPLETGCFWSNKERYFDGVGYVLVSSSVRQHIRFNP